MHTVVAAQSDVLLLSLTCSIELPPEGKLLPTAIDPSANTTHLVRFLLSWCDFFVF